MSDKVDAFRVGCSQLENNHLTKMCGDSEAGSYLMRIDFVYHSTLGVIVIKKIKKKCHSSNLSDPAASLHIQI
jgi:hypothetical protein